MKTRKKPRRETGSPANHDRAYEVLFRHLIALINAAGIEGTIVPADPRGRCCRVASNRSHGEQAFDLLISASAVLQNAAARESLCPWEATELAAAVERLVREWREHNRDAHPALLPITSTDLN